MKDKLPDFKRACYLPIWKRYAVLLCSALFLIFPMTAEGETVTFLLFIDFPLLKTLVLQSAFDGPDQSAPVLDQNNGCHRIILSDPAFREKDSLVYLETKFYTRMGAFVKQQCILPVECTGRLSVLLRPVIHKPWVLKFRLEGLTLYGNDGDPLQLDPAVAPLMSGFLSNYLEDFAFDLGPSVNEVKSFIMPLIPAPYRDRAQRMLQSMRHGSTVTSFRGLRVEILAEAEIVYREETEPQALTESDLEALIHTWEALDVFLVRLITSMTVSPLSPLEKHGLASILLESRYDFVVRWSEGTLGNDFVRQQFKEIWRKISNLLREHLCREPPESALRHLAFYTASEALSVLDKIGPSLGIKISRDGLIRLARLLTGDKSLELAYQSEIDPQLREIFGLGKTLLLSRPNIEEPAIELNPDDNPSHGNPGDPTSWLLQDLFPSRAWAQSEELETTLSEIRDWLPRPDNLDSYLDKVRHLLGEASHRVMSNPEPIPSYSSFFPNLVLAIAWQESCFRQFVAEDKKIVFLRSYNGTSVGLMQVNERVWRGLYNPHSLRWDIRYNAQAGCEIIDLYLRQYALAEAKGENSLNNDTLARLVYAMYNGGPGQLSKFMERHRKGDYFLSDKFFYEKYLWVTREAWKNVDRCLVGG